MRGPPQVCAEKNEGWGSRGRLKPALPLGRGRARPPQRETSPTARAQGGETRWDHIPPKGSARGPPFPKGRTQGAAETYRRRERTLELVKRRRTAKKTNGKLQPGRTKPAEPLGQMSGRGRGATITPLRRNRSYAPFSEPTVTSRRTRRFPSQWPLTRETRCGEIKARTSHTPRRSPSSAKRRADGPDPAALQRDAAGTAQAARPPGTPTTKLTRST